MPFVGDLCNATSLLMLTLLSELLAVAYTVLSSGIAAFNFLILAYASLFLLWAALGGAALLCRLKPVFSKLSTAASAGFSFAVCLCWVALLSVASQWLISAMAGRSVQLDWWWILDTLVMATIIIGIGLRYAYLSQQLRLRQQSALNAQLDALQSRIRPHFLFNTLNSISSLIAINPAKAEEAVEDLASLFRANLDGSQRLVPWSQERELCESYLRIEQHRLGVRLQVQWHEEGDLSGVKLPSLILQPLLENAVLHGIQCLTAGGVLDVQVSARPDRLTVVVKNPVPETASAEGSGMANNNIRQRLQHVFGAAASLTERCQNKVYIARLSVPITGGASA